MAHRRPSDGVKIVGKLCRISMKSHYMFATRKVHYGANLCYLQMYLYAQWNLLANDKITASWQHVHVCLPSIILNVPNNRNKLWKTVRLTSFQKPWLQSVLIFFKFVHLYLLLTFWVVLCFTQFGGRTTVSNLINFMIKPF